MRHFASVAALTGIAISALAFGGCGTKEPERIFHLPPSGTPSAGAESKFIRSSDAYVSAHMGDIVSTNGLWHAYVVVASDKTLTMVIEGETYKKEFPVAAPVSFSPNSHFLIFSSDGGYGTLGVYILALPPKQSARRVSNLIKIRNGMGGKSLMPVPMNTIVTWTNDLMRYTVQNDGTFELNLATQKIERVSP